MDLCVPRQEEPVLMFWLCLAVCGTTSAAAASDEPARRAVRSVAGTVTATGADGNRFPAEGVRLILTCEPGEAPRVEVSDQQGAFAFEAVPVSGCRVVTELQGFAPATGVVRPNSGDLRFELKTVPIFAGVNVVARTPKRRR
jgi:hypothetical protein